jgi:hypothetical protein
MVSLEVRKVRRGLGQVSCEEGLLGCGVRMGPPMADTIHACCGRIFVVPIELTCERPAAGYFKSACPLSSARVCIGCLLPITEARQRVRPISKPRVAAVQGIAINCIIPRMTLGMPA